MRASLVCFLFLSMAGIVSAQSKGGIPPSGDTIQMNGALRELYFRSLADGSVDAKEEAARQAEIAYQRRIFDEKLKHFVSLWKKMTKQMNEQNTFDAKLAHRLSDAFHEIETSNGWPVREQK